MASNGKLINRTYALKFNKVLRQKEEDNTYKAVLNLIEDTSLVWFLQEKYPKVWNEYCKFKSGNKGTNLNEVVETLEGKK